MSTESEMTSPATTASGGWSAHQPVRAVLAYGAAYLLVSVGGRGLAGLRLPLPWLAALAVLVMIATLALSLLVVLSISRLRLSAGAEVAWLFGMVALFLIARPDLFVVAARLLGNPGRGRHLADLLTISAGQPLVGNLALILWAVFLGRIVSRVIREGKLLLPVAVVASIADIVTVFWGVVAHMTEKAPEVVHAFSAQAPVVPPPVLPLPVLSSVGIGDFLFLAVFLSVAARYSMQASKAMWATLVVMLVAPLAFLIWPQAPGLPGVPFISLAVLGVNRQHFTFSRDEKRALAFAGVLVAAITAWAILRH